MVDELLKEGTTVCAIDLEAMNTVRTLIGDKIGPKMTDCGICYYSIGRKVIDARVYGKRILVTGSAGLLKSHLCVTGLSMRGFMSLGWQRGHRRFEQH